MNIKFGVSALLFASVLGANGAANAQTIRDDRYLGNLEAGIQSQPVKVGRKHAAPLRTYLARRHAKMERKLRTRQVAARTEDAAPRSVIAMPDAGGNKSSLSALIAAKAAAHGVPVALATAVVRVESNYNPNVTGRAGEVGLMQIKYQTARGLGYSGSRAALYDPATNLEWGMRYLAGAHKLAGGSLCGTLAKYQGGHGTRGSRTTHNYCGCVQTVMTGRGA